MLLCNKLQRKQSKMANTQKVSLDIDKKTGNAKVKIFNVENEFNYGTKEEKLLALEFAFLFEVLTNSKMSKIRLDEIKEDAKKHPRKPTLISFFYKIK